MVGLGFVSVSSWASPLFGLGIEIVAQGVIDCFGGNGICCSVVVSLSVLCVDSKEEVKMGPERSPFNTDFTSFKNKESKIRYAFSAYL